MYGIEPLPANMVDRVEVMRGGGDNIELPPHEAMIAEQTKHGINTGGLKFDWFSKNQKHHAEMQNFLNSFQDFDYGADRDSGYMFGPTLPRTFFFGVRLMY